MGALSWGGLRKRTDHAAAPAARQHAHILVADGDHVDRCPVAEDLVAGWAAGRVGGGLRDLLPDDVVAQVDALVADVDARAGDELLYLPLTLAAERALARAGARLGQRLFDERAGVV